MGKNAWVGPVLHNRAGSRSKRLLQVVIHPKSILDFPIGLGTKLGTIALVARRREFLHIGRPPPRRFPSFLHPMGPF